ncbi:MAG TPA: hypothetical protein VKT31_03005 [Solirubrobacteraceae bacterium]|nr:hypothetical protein [Solirubrobacteraceae bacterium]
MNDNWRLRINLHGHGLARSLSERLDASTIEHRLETSFRDRVIVSVDGPEVFCYTGTRAQAEAAEQAIRGLAAEHGWELDAELRRWHPESEEWEDADVPLPDSDADREAERAELIRREREESDRQGFPSYEVRVECATEGDCEAFAARLEAEGLRVVRRSRFLVIGAADEDTARALAARVHHEAPDGSAVVAEGTVPAVMSVSGGNPFAVFGGLAG